MDPAGNATYVLVNSAANDVRITRDSHNCAPALSNDGSTLYVAVKGTNSNYAYLLGLDSTNLATKYKVFLRNPGDNQPSSVTDSGTASPMVGPDGDVFFGVLANNGSVGFLLHYSADLQTKKIPGGFGWDYTAAIVPTNMVPSYSGPSSYLLFSKYNNYAGAGNAINRIALLDPNVPQTDPNPVNSGVSDMREVLTVIGCTPDAEYITQTNGRYPFAVREWCINTAAVNPATKSVFAPSEDGHLYRWDLSANALAEVVTLDPGVGEPYVPTVIGPDGTVFTLNAETLFAIGNPTNFSVAIYSSASDLRYTVVGQPVTFTAIVTNFSGGDPDPAGTITFQDVTYQGIAPITNILAANVPLSNGIAAVTNSSLIAATNAFGNHFITAIYSGDTNFPPGRATLVQKVHASGTMMTLTSSVSSTTNVTFSALVSATSSLTNKPTGAVSFWDGTQFLAQVGLNSNRLAVVTVTNFPVGNHSISATYASDTLFASSSANLSTTRPTLLNPTALSNGNFQFTFTSSPAAPFTVFGSSDLTLPLSNWAVLGIAIETSLGHYQFTDSAADSAVRFYSVRSP
jgi:Bacterial Ig-like domain (group 3)